MVTLTIILCVLILLGLIGLGIITGLISFFGDFIIAGLIIYGVIKLIKKIREK